MFGKEVNADQSAGPPASPHLTRRRLAQRLERDAPGVSAQPSFEGAWTRFSPWPLSDCRPSFAARSPAPISSRTLGDDPQGLWQREALAIDRDGAALDRRDNERSKLKAHKQLPHLRAALIAHHEKTSGNRVLANQATAALTSPMAAIASSVFNNVRDIPPIVRDRRWRMSRFPAQFVLGRLV